MMTCKALVGIILPRICKLKIIDLEKLDVKTSSKVLFYVIKYILLSPYTSILRLYVFYVIKARALLLRHICIS